MTQYYRPVWHRKRIGLLSGRPREEGHAPAIVTALLCGPHAGRAWKESGRREQLPPCSLVVVGTLFWITEAVTYVAREAWSEHGGLQGSRRLLRSLVPSRRRSSFESSISSPTFVFSSILVIQDSSFSHYEVFRCTSSYPKNQIVSCSTRPESRFLRLGSVRVSPV